MKKELFLRHLRNNDCYCVRQHKGSHAFYRNSKTGASSVVPIHGDIKELLARKICKDLGIPYCGNN